MINRLKSATILVLCASTVAACGVRTAVPGFKYPVYDANTPWPKLSPTADLQKQADIKVEADLKEAEKLKALVN